MQSIAIDFITGLPKSNGIDAIMTVTGRLTKMVHVLPTQSKATASDIASLFFRQFVRCHGIPKNIVSDRDSKFISHFWQALSKLLNIKLKMSSTDHPQSDGQSERTNRTVIEMLRALVNERGSNWLQFLPLIEICINNSKQVSTGYSPYFINYGYHPNFNALFNNVSTTSNVPAAEEFFKRIRDATAQAKLNIEQAQVVQKQQADRSRRCHSFKVGDMVYLTAKQVKQQSVSSANSLARCTFKIIHQINENGFALKLLPTWKIKYVFHVSKLRLVHQNDDNPDH